LFKLDLRIGAPFGVKAHHAVGQAVGHDVELAHLVVNIRLVFPIRPVIFRIGFEREEVGVEGEFQTRELEFERIGPLLTGSGVGRMSMLLTLPTKTPSNQRTAMAKTGSR
jgi:hypothetical protein